MATALSQIPTTDYRLGFQSQEEETAVERLPVQGEVPAWLTGSLMRVTPAKLEVGDRRVGHWFDGLAALNRFGFADGKVSYRSRFLDTKAYRAAKAGGRCRARASAPTPAARSSSACSRSSRPTSRTTRT